MRSILSSLGERSLSRRRPKNDGSFKASRPSSVGEISFSLQNCWQSDNTRSREIGLLTLMRSVSRDNSARHLPSTGLYTNFPSLHSGKENYFFAACSFHNGIVSQVLSFTSFGGGLL